MQWVSWGHCNVLRTVVTVADQVVYEWFSTRIFTKMRCGVRRGVTLLWPHAKPVTNGSAHRDLGALATPDQPKHVCSWVSLHLGGILTKRHSRLSHFRNSGYPVSFASYACWIVMHANLPSWALLTFDKIIGISLIVMQLIVIPVSSSEVPYHNHVLSSYQKGSLPSFVKILHKS